MLDKISAITKEKVAEMKRISSAETVRELIANAMGIYEFLLKAEERGAVVIIREADGRQYIMEAR